MTGMNIRTPDSLDSSSHIGPVGPDKRIISG